ncbi:GNAT family N-acetyltransferase [Microbacterium ureisolvens]|uniref:GNAT family N-acetyltransferase n=1 Tax=Microbacterium ureisolvens TaxID=2781186 RepID=A0ABS7I2F3_9MICO|nr:GNAT family protein [Microbacterium ureisolvens]MBW9110668.1 GNAT family N-acetyltransferase [Microbacterium ureisolvens]
MEPVTLGDDEVLLSRPVEDDIAALVEHCADPEIVAFTTVPVPYDRDYATRYVQELVPQRWASGKKLVWGIRRRQLPGRLLGVINLFDVDTGRGTAEVGYWLAKEGRGKGIATRAVSIVLDYAFLAESAGGLGLFRVQWTAAVENAASRRVAEHVGLRYEGLLRGALVLRGRRTDALRAAVLASDERVPQEWVIADEALHTLSLPGPYN